MSLISTEVRPSEEFVPLLLNYSFINSTNAMWFQFVHCLSAGLTKIYPPDFYEISAKGCNREEAFTFWSRSESCGRHINCFNLHRFLWESCTLYAPPYDCSLLHGRTAAFSHINMLQARVERHETYEHCVCAHRPVTFCHYLTEMLWDCCYSPTSHPVY